MQSDSSISEQCDNTSHILRSRALDLLWDVVESRNLLINKEHGEVLEL